MKGQDQPWGGPFVWKVKHEVPLNGYIGSFSLLMLILGGLLVVILLLPRVPIEDMLTFNLKGVGKEQPLFIRVQVMSIL